MDYEVGTLSDLITGSHTPNKKKVFEKKFTPNKKKTPKISNGTPSTNRVSSEKRSKKFKSNNSLVSELESDVNVAAEFQSADVAASVSKKSKKKRKLLDRSTDGQSELDSTISTFMGQFKKRKLNNILDEDASVSDAETSPKKSKNDINAERRVKKKLKSKIKIEPDEEELAKTIYVGNLPITSKKEKVKQFFMKYGTVDKVRIRGITPTNPKIPKKVAIIKQEFHPSRKSFYAYVKFSSAEDANKATAANGTVYHEHHIRVQVCSNKDKPDESKAIFVGNMPLDTEDEELWNLFEPCGSISSVRVVRDNRTGMGKGIGFVNFHSSDSIQLALEMGNVQLRDRELRITLCNNNAAKKNKNRNKRKPINKPGKLKIRKDKGENKMKDGGGEVEKRTAPIQANFQGTKVAKKKKSNFFNKGLQQKKKMMKQIVPKSNQAL